MNVIFELKNFLTNKIFFLLILTFSLLMGFDIWRLTVVVPFIQTIYQVKEKNITFIKENSAATINSLKESSNSYSPQKKASQIKYFETVPLQMEELLNKDDYLQFNQLHLNAILDGTNVLGIMGLTGKYPIFQEAMVKNLVANEIDDTALFEQTRSLGQMGIILNLPFMTAPSSTLDRIPNTQFIPIFLFGLSASVALFFTNDQRNRHDAFVNLLPTFRGKIILFRFMIVASSFLVAVFISLSTITLFRGLNPNYGFGTLHYPYSYVNPADAAHPFIVTIGQYLLKYFGYLTVWAVFMTSLGFLVSRFTKEVLVVLGVLCLPLFMNNLGLQSLVGKFSGVFPTNYLPFTNLLLNRGELALVSDLRAVMVILSWSVFFLLVSGVVIKVRGRI
ncbi:hypothetical protein [Enterococcus timonensis]|uniref:hypothetical protein n=1 Tax=Enterococcus timonensis TaxID=1852364 RepID=UPI0008D93A8C|nr:hypothetical protein [Enterococcus timonensis]